MQTKVTPKIVHPWLLGASLFVVGIFAGAGIQLVRAQTATFTDPTCNPGEACNPGTPIVSTSGSSQTISSPLTLNGDLTLGATNRLLKTGTNIEAINVSNSANFAIVAGTSSSSHYAIQANGTGSGGGIMGNVVNGNAIYGKATGSGLAGFFEGTSKFFGNVQIGRALNGQAEPAIAGNLTIPNGNLTVSSKTTTTDITVLNSLEVNGSLIVNGQNVVSGSMQQVTLFASIPNTGTNYKDFTAANITGSSSPYRFISAQVLVSNAAGSPRTWANGGTTAYTECSGGSFLGTLRVTNATLNNPGAFRILVTYQKASVNCANADVTPPVVTVTSPADNANVAGATLSIVASATDTSAISSYDYYVNGTKVGTNATGTLANYSIAAYPYSPPKLTIYVTATDAAGNVGTSLPIQVNRVNNLCNPICSAGTQCYFRGCNGNQNDWECAINQQSVSGCDNQSPNA